MFHVHSSLEITGFAQCKFALQYHLNFQVLQCLPTIETPVNGEPRETIMPERGTEDEQRRVAEET